jgi:dipeptidyl aminopeptidase/acylaminoacyl peptidase
MKNQIGKSLTTFFIAFTFIVCAQHIIAQDSSKARRENYAIAQYLNIRSATSPTFSPDGRRIAFLLNETGTPQVWIINADGSGEPRQLTNYPDRVDFVAWSPTSDWLIFGKAVGGNENAQFYLLAPDTGEIKPLTDEPKIRHNFGGWSHDGKKISYSSNKRDPNFFDVYVMDVSTGREELIYQQNGSNNPVAWSFDDRQIIVSRENEQLSLDNDLYLVDLATKQATHLTPHTGAAQFENVHFTRDGSGIILTTNVGREWLTPAHLNFQTKRIEFVSNNEWDVETIAIPEDWRQTASMIKHDRTAFVINHDGYDELSILIYQVSTGRQTVALPKGVISGLRFSGDGRYLAFAFNNATANSDVWRYDTLNGELKQITHAARAGIPQESFVAPELIHYKTFDGREIPAWYYIPQSLRPPSGKQNPLTIAGKQYFIKDIPVIVSVHGGPEGQERPAFNPIYQYFLSRGYAILAPNVRGSTGYGKTYTHLDDVRHREDSVRDLAYAVEWLKTSGGADPRRIAVMGGSYGGYMTLAAITLYPDLWAAAVDTVGIANFESFLKNTSGYRRKLREVEYGSLERDLEFLRAISPIYKVDKIRAPLMVIHGRNDPRVPYTESEQIVKALRERGAPVEYVLFDDEGHGVAKLKNRLIVYPKVVEFLDKYMGANSAKPTTHATK